MIITRDTLEKFKDAYVHALAITLKESLSDSPKQKDDYLWNKLNELYQEPIDEDKLTKLAEQWCPESGSYREGDIETQRVIRNAYKAGYRKAIQQQ